MPIDIRPADFSSIPALAELFGADKVTAGCWCMWFIIAVKAYHAAGAAGNRASFTAIATDNPHPMGVIAWRDQTPVGWCAVGPRSRYARAMKTPTYAGRDPSEDATVWMIPCLYLKKDARRAGHAELLVRAAAALARDHGATAVECFPLTGEKRRTADTQVGFESVFARCGFAPLRRPSDSRVVMRLDF